MLQDYTVIDLEMTGLNVKKDKVIEIGAARIRGGKVEDTYSCFVKTDHEIPERITELTGITPEMVSGGIPEKEAFEGLMAFAGQDVLLGQNFSYDYRFIAQWAANSKVKLSFSYLDTIKIARALLPADQSKSLEALCTYFGVSRENAHRAFEDAIETHEVYEKLAALAEREGRSEEKVFSPTPLYFKVKKISPVTQHQLEQIKKYREAHNVTEPIDWGCLTRSEASRLMDHYYNTYGR